MKRWKNTQHPPLSLNSLPSCPSSTSPSRSYTSYSSLFPSLPLASAPLISTFSQSSHPLIAIFDHDYIQHPPIFPHFPPSFLSCSISPSFPTCRPAYFSPLPPLTSHPPQHASPTHHSIHLPSTSPPPPTLVPAHHTTHSRLSLSLFLTFRLFDVAKSELSECQELAVSTVYNCTVSTVHRNVYSTINTYIVCILCKKVHIVWKYIICTVT